MHALGAAPAGELDRQPPGQRAGGVVAQPAVGQQRAQRQQAARAVPQLLVARLGPRQAHPGALGLDAGHRTRADDLGGERVEVLAAALVDPVVVGAQEPAITGSTQRGRSENGSPASIEDNSITHAPWSGPRCLPWDRRTVWWLAWVIARSFLGRI